MKYAGILFTKIVGIQYYKGHATDGEFVIIRREPSNRVCIAQIRFALNTNHLTLICSMILMRFVSTMSAGNKLDTYRGKWHRRWLDIWYEKHDLS